MVEKKWEENAKSYGVKVENLIWLRMGHGFLLEYLEIFSSQLHL